jgi:ligand-binding sensor domain-containing protein
VLLPLAPAAASRAEQLPFRHYGPADGLAGSLVRAIYQDHKGYVWLGASDGLGRFDGHSFVNYGVRDGLPVPAVNAIAEDRRGRPWLGINGIAFDASGSLWCLTDHGLYRSDSEALQLRLVFRRGPYALAKPRIAGGWPV